MNGGNSVFKQLSNDAKGPKLAGEEFEHYNPVSAGTNKVATSKIKEGKSPYIKGPNQTKTNQEY
jgi:hypothetical protein